MTVRELMGQAGKHRWEDFSAWLLRHLGDDPLKAWTSLPRFDWQLFWLGQCFNRELVALDGPARLLCADLLQVVAATVPDVPKAFAEIVHGLPSYTGGDQPHAQMRTFVEALDALTQKQMRPLRPEERRQHELYAGAGCLFRAVANEDGPGCWLRTAGGHLWDATASVPKTNKSVLGLIRTAYPKPPFLGQSEAAA